MKPSFATAAFSAALLCLNAFGQAAQPSPLPNPGFEEGEAGWSIRKDTFSQLSSEAARTGKQGLRVATVPPSPYGSSAASARFEVAPGQAVSSSCWARSRDAFCGVYLTFYTQSGGMITLSGADAKSAHSPIRGGDGEWREYAQKAVAPADAASAGIWVHAYSNTKGTADFDDFSLHGVSANQVADKPRKEAAAKPPAPAAPAKPRDPNNPQVVILKMDDLTQQGANRSKGEAVSARLRNYVDTVRRLDVKASLGLIGNSLPDGDQAYFDWIKALHQEGRIEIWNHGYTHAEHPKVEGKRRAEFYGLTVEEQTENLMKTQRLAKEKLGFALTAFGSPFNLCDDATEQALEACPEITAWLFGPERPKCSKKTILPRRLNLEMPTMTPNSAHLIETYERQGSSLDLIVLQGHPNGWNDQRLAEFEKAVVFLKGKGCVFMTPSEYVQKRASRR